MSIYHQRCLETTSAEKLIYYRCKETNDWHFYVSMHHSPACYVCTVHETITEWWP